MAFYGFLMQLENDTQLSEADEHRMVIISEIGGAMSMISCVMVFGLLCFLPIKNDGLFITGNMCLVIMAAQLSFLGSENAGYPHPMMCKIAACVLHYFFTCQHFASLSYALHLLSKVGPKFLKVCQRKIAYVAMIWLVPAVIVLLTVILKGEFYARETRCWLPLEDKTRLAFLIPLAIIQMVNFPLYLMITRAGIILDLTKGVSKRSLVKNVIFSSLSMFSILSLLWVFGFAVTFDGPLILKYIFVVLASGQGLLILVFHVIPNNRVQKALCSKIADSNNVSKDDDATTSDGQDTLDSKVGSPPAEEKKDKES